MSRKLPIVLPIAILLGAVSAAPTLALARSHHVVQPDYARVSPYAYGSVISGSYETQSRQAKREADRRALGETPALPFTQDPASPKGW
jgi:hypothetical protein